MFIGFFGRVRVGTGCAREKKTRQSAALRALSFSDAVPGGHGVHADRPMVSEKNPEEHPTQEDREEAPEM